MVWNASMNIQADAHLIVFADDDRKIDAFWRAVYIAADDHEVHVSINERGRERVSR